MQFSDCEHQRKKLLLQNQQVSILLVMRKFWSQVSILSVMRTVRGHVWYESRTPEIFPEGKNCGVSRREVGVGENFFVFWCRVIKFGRHIGEHSKWWNLKFHEDTLGSACVTQVYMLPTRGKPSKAFTHGIDTIPTDFSPSPLQCLKKSQILLCRRQWQESAQNIHFFQTLKQHTSQFCLTVIASDISFKSS